MANQRIAPGFPFPVYVNETDSNSRIAPGVYVDETSGGGATAYTLTAAQGSFALNGQTAGLKAARKVTAAQGSFLLNGQTAGLKAARVVTAAQGSFALNGQAANLNKGKTLTAAQGSFALNGQAVLFHKTLKLAATYGSFLLNGQAATLTWSGQVIPLIYSGYPVRNYVLKSTGIERRLASNPYRERVLKGPPLPARRLQN